MYQQGMMIAQSLNHTHDTGRVLAHIGLTYTAFDDPENAINYYLQSIQVLDAINAVYRKARVIAHLGNAYALTGRFGEAKDALVQARLLFDDVHMYRGYTLHTYYTANYYRQQKRFQYAERNYQRAIGLSDAVQDRYGQAQCLLEYARLLKEQGREPEALRAARSALSIYKERGTEEQVAKVQAWINL